MTQNRKIMAASHTSGPLLSSEPDYPDWETKCEPPGKPVRKLAEDHRFFSRTLRTQGAPAEVGFEISRPSLGSNDSLRGIEGLDASKMGAERAEGGCLSAPRRL
jgi:hypothetical protein